MSGVPLVTFQVEVREERRREEERRRVEAEEARLINNILDV
jgi:hypothetical protein